MHRIVNGHHDITGCLLKADDANSLFFSAASRHLATRRWRADERRQARIGVRLAGLSLESNEVKQFGLALTDREASELLLRGLKRNGKDGHFLIT